MGLALWLLMLWRVLVYDEDGWLVNVDVERRLVWLGRARNSCGV